jgi:Holliday junction resolvase YEN1
LIALSIHPVFVFDGPNKPPFKRNKRTGPNVASIPEFLAKQLLKQFGYPIHLAPGEAEAECALLQREGIVDAVLSEDVDTLMFGSGITIRNWSPEKTGKTPTHVNVYDAIETKNGPSALDREGMILVALMSGGDYVPEGIPGCGPKTACEAAKAGFGHDLCKIPTTDRKAMSEWRERLQHELKTNESKLFRRKHTTLKIPNDFPRLDILGYYTHPAISNQTGLDKLRRSINFDQELDLSGLREFTHDAFDWVKLEGAKHFIRSLAPSLLVRQLRLRAAKLDRLPPDDLQAVQEDEALTVKGIHGKRQHPITDNSTELRVSFSPIELVKIDLSREEPDDEPDIPPPHSEDIDLDDEVALELEDDGPKKRGPTKFDPQKPARIWVMESFVKAGVPLKVQDWEAERQIKQKPRRAATVQESGIAAQKEKSGAKRTKTTGDMPQAPIERFAKVTKPGLKTSRALAKTLGVVSDLPQLPPLPTPQPPTDIVDLSSSSPPRPQNPPPAPRLTREKSLSPVLEDLPASVTKRRRRAPMQRAQTLPSGTGSILDQRFTSPLLETIEVLDLISSPVPPSPSQLHAKKAKTRMEIAPLRRAPRDTSVASSPGKTRQTTLDTWGTSTTPTKRRDNGRLTVALSIPAVPDFQHVLDEVDELDLTLSSPGRSTSPHNPYCPTNSRRSVTTGTKRAPLTSITSNTSPCSTSIASSKLSETKGLNTTRTELQKRRTSPRLRKTKSASPELETLDLTFSQPFVTKVAIQTISPDVEVVDLSTMSSPEPPCVPTTHISATSSIVAPVSPPPTHIPSPSPRRSPRNHVSLSPEHSTRTSPPAAWKAREKKKRQIVLRKSVAGRWDYADIDSPQKSDVVLKGTARRKWRESEVEILDLS